MELELEVAGWAVIATHDGAATVGDLRAAVTGKNGPLYVGGRALAADRPLASARLVSGQALSVEPTGAPAPATARRVSVAGGLHGGAAAGIWPGRPLTVGRGRSCELRVADEEVSRVHVRFSASERAVTATDAGSRNGVRWGAARLTGPAELAPGDVLGIGETLLELAEPDPTSADLTDEPDRGGRAFNRPPHIAVPRQRVQLEVPVPPAPPVGFRFPLVAMLAPMAMGLAMYLALHVVYLLFMMAASPIMLLANTFGDRRSGRKKYQAGMREYEAAAAAFHSALGAAARADELRSRADAPHPSELVRRASTPAATLWQRRPRDPEFLRLRLGLVDRPADVTLTRTATDQKLPPLPIVRDVPISVDLRDAEVLGIAGPRAGVLAAARAQVLQAAVLHAPSELAIVVITGADTAADWEWASWLPHTSPWSSAFACRRLVATDAAQAEARVAELLRLLEERAAERHVMLAAGPPPGRAVLVVLDGARRMRGVPGLAQLFTSGAAGGVYAICLDADETALPDECRATLVTDPGAPTRATVRRPGAQPVGDVLVDGLTAPHALLGARSLTPIRALGTSDADTELPERVRFTELVDVAAIEPGRTSRAVIGVGPDGPITVDLVKDGPHALVTGTSGSGKSELLQTLVASLALGNTPDAMSFVLVDYKGGSAFAACADLPHCVGLVTDLDGHLVRRALDSLSAELRRREALFAEAGAKDIDDYWARTGARLPRLVIVVDEFASLVEEIPEFVPGVVGIGMRGRSLGVHVVLATQRPGGVVSADMRANVNLRISLRVTSDAESMDVIDSPVAARIPARQPGRAYLRTGHRELTPFQAARVGWPLDVERPRHEPTVVITPRRIDLLGRPVDRATAADVDEHGRTDLTDLVAAIRAAASDVPPPERPWLPPLPEQLPLAAIPAVGEHCPAAVLGVVDRPAAQAQDPFVLDLADTGPVLVAGAARSGRSTALRTLAASLVAGAAPSDLHVYVLDCGNALGVLAELPHCGAVVDGADEARTDRLLSLLGREVERRGRLLAAGGYGSVAEQRAAVAAPDRLPYVVVLLDRLEAFVNRYAEMNGGVLVDRLETLLRTGPAVGVVCVLAGDRTGFTHRIASAVASRLVLRQATPEDMVHFGVDHRAVPTTMPDGRAIWTATGEEVQLALLDADPSGAAQVAAVRRLAHRLARAWDGTAPELLPRRVDQLPDHVNAQVVAELRTRPRPAGPAVVTVGVGGDHLAPVDVDLAALGCFVVAGPARSGRSTALCALVDSLSGAVPVIAVAPRPSPLRDVPGVITSDLPTQLGNVLAATPGPLVLVIDDGELVDDRVLGDQLERFVRQARDTGSVLIAAGTTEDVLLNRYRGWFAAARRERTGLLLNPTSHVDGEVFDLRLPRSTSGGWPPGRALFTCRGEVMTVQIPMPEAVAAR